MGLTYALPRLESARHEEISKCAAVVEHCFAIISRLIVLASKDESLQTAVVFLIQLHTGIEETLVFRQPAMSALFLSNRLRQSTQSDSVVDRDALRVEIKELRQFSGASKTGFPEFHGWAGANPAAVGGNTCSSFGHAGSGSSMPPAAGTNLGSHFGNAGPGYNMQPAPSAQGFRNFPAPNKGHFPAPFAGHYTPPHNRGRGGGGGGRGRGGGRRLGGRGSPVCANCARNGLQANHQHHSCPHVVCHKCNEKGHIQALCPLP